MWIFRDKTNQDMFTDGMEWKWADNFDDYMKNDIPVQGRTWMSSPRTEMVPVWHGQKCKIWLKLIKLCSEQNVQSFFLFCTTATSACYIIIIIFFVIKIHLIRKLTTRRKQCEKKWRCQVHNSSPAPVYFMHL